MEKIFSSEWEKFKKLSDEATNACNVWKAYLDSHYNDITGKVEILYMHEYREIKKKKVEAFKARNNAFIEFESHIRNSILNIA